MNVADQEQFFIGVDAQSDPGIMKPGFVSDAQNRRFVSGVATPRKGTVVMPWANKQAAYWDYTKTYQSGDLVQFSGFRISDGYRQLTLTSDVSDGITPTANVGPLSSNLKTSLDNVEPAGPYFEANQQTLNGYPLSAYDSNTNLVTLNSSWNEKGTLYLKYPGSIYGASNFETPNGIEHLIIATSQGIFVTSPDSASEEVKVNGFLYGNASYPTITNSNKVRFVQCFNNLVMFRGEDFPPLVLKENILDGFQSITQEETPEADENDDDGTEQIPNSSTGLFFGNRLVVPFGRDEVAVSDYLNYTRYQPVRSAFRVNTGSSDKLVSVFKFDPNTLLVFKESSIYSVRNVYGDLADAMLDQVTNQYGCAAERSIVSAGSDVIFLSDQRGVVSLRQSVAGETQSVDVPLSQPIQPIIDRIDWTKASDAVGAYSNNRYYLAVPLRDVNTSTSGNNAILVYDFLTKAWSGIDYIDGLSVKDFCFVNYKGAKRLFVVATNGDTDGQILLYDDPQYGGIDDQTIGANNKTKHNVIQGRLLTRGFTCGVPDKKRYNLMLAFVECYNGAYTVTGHSDGVNETVEISNESFSRTQYEAAIVSDYTSNNSDDNFFDEGREDYAVKASDNIVCGSNGFAVDRKQAHTDRDRFKIEGQYLQLEFKSTSGLVDIRGCNLIATVRSRLVDTES
ncbi:hypothetical protein N8555_01150 [bacterium]|nr:hypothetical protein [Verrucomicrobiota bacterium]MDA7669613.1 hypothetical protein [bacterium]